MSLAIAFEGGCADLREGARAQRIQDINDMLDAVARAVDQDVVEPGNEGAPYLQLERASEAA